MARMGTAVRWPLKLLLSLHILASRPIKNKVNMTSSETPISDVQV